MHSLPTRSMDIVFERLLQMNQSALARTIHPVLQGREGDRFFCRTCHSLKQSLDEFIACEAAMRGYAGENGGERPEPSGS